MAEEAVQSVKCDSPWVKDSEDEDRQRFSFFKKKENKSPVNQML